MANIETARIKEVLGVQIGVVQECAQELKVKEDIDEIEVDIGRLEKATAELKKVIDGIPHGHRQ